jgi:hypothetical protein
VLAPAALLLPCASSTRCRRCPTASPREGPAGRRVDAREPPLMVIPGDALSRLARAKSRDGVRAAAGQSEPGGRRVAPRACPQGHADCRDPRPPLRVRAAGLQPAGSVAAGVGGWWLRGPASEWHHGARSPCTSTSRSTVRRSHMAASVSTSRWRSRSSRVPESTHHRRREKHATSALRPPDAATRVAQALVLHPSKLAATALRDATRGDEPEAVEAAASAIGERPDEPSRTALEALLSHPSERSATAPSTRHIRARRLGAAPSDAVLRSAAARDPSADVRALIAEVVERS